MHPENLMQSPKANFRPEISKQQAALQQSKEHKDQPKLPKEVSQQTMEQQANICTADTRSLDSRSNCTVSTSNNDTETCPNNQNSQQLYHSMMPYRFSSAEYQALLANKARKNNFKFANVQNQLESIANSPRPKSSIAAQGKQGVRSYQAAKFKKSFASLFDKKSEIVQKNKQEASSHPTVEAFENFPWVKKAQNSESVKVLNGKVADAISKDVTQMMPMKSKSSLASADHGGTPGTLLGCNSLAEAKGQKFPRSLGQGRFSGGQEDGIIASNYPLPKSTDPGEIVAFVEKLKALLDMEWDAETVQSVFMLEDFSFHELEYRNMALTNMYVKSVSPGIYDRVLLHLERKNNYGSSEFYKIKQFCPEDIVGVFQYAVNKRGNAVYGKSVNGIVYKVHYDEIIISLSGMHDFENFKQPITLVLLANKVAYKR